jgi:hypothetical protein
MPGGSTRPHEQTAADAIVRTAILAIHQRKADPARSGGVIEVQCGWKRIMDADEHTKTDAMVSITALDPFPGIGRDMLDA